MTNTKCRWCGFDYDSFGPEHRKSYERGCPKHPWNKYFRWLQDFHAPSYFFGAAVMAIAYITFKYLLE